MKRLLLPILLLPWLVLGIAVLQTPPVPGKGNAPTYSGNGKGEQDAETIKQCAFYAAGEAPKLNRDVVFVLCLDENGVWSI